jgi:hypothetical protein
VEFAEGRVDADPPNPAPAPACCHESSVIGEANVDTIASANAPGCTVSAIAESLIARNATLGRGRIEPAVLSLHRKYTSPGACAAIGHNAAR